MGYGIYGKLPAKRDFIAVEVPANVLNVIERWLQGGVASSRNTMGGAWQDIYLTAPIWHFWLGADICGTYCMGSIMPSVDGIGRYFPLALLAYGEDGETIAPPLDDACNEWFDRVDRILLSALDTEQDLDGFALVRLLSGTDVSLQVANRTTATPLRSGFFWTAEENGITSSVPENVRDEDYYHAAQTRTYWWTGGGQRFGPRFISQTGMPDPGLYRSFLTGEA